MKKMIPQILILLLFPAAALPQKILTLKECYDLADAANAIAGEREIHNEISSTKDKNISKGWLPVLDANASAAYQSDVVEMGTALASVPIPGLADAFPVMPHDQYKFSLDINQVIYDGGAIRGARKAEQAELQVNLKQTEADLYKYRSQVNSYYFSILLQDKQRELLGNYLELLNKRIATLSSAAENGVVLRTDIDVLTSEKLKIEQQVNEALIRKEALLKVLSQVTGTKLDPSVTLVIPEIPARIEDSLQRPEIELFDLRKKQLEAGLEITKSKRMPKIFGYASFGYGSPPGQDFFEEDFGTYYMLGGGIKWNIFDWNKTRNEKEIISLQQNLIENRKRDMSDNLKRQLELKDAEIRSLSSLAESDARIIEIRKRISATAESQYENGTITATDYLNEINSERQALVNGEIHKISLAMARVEYMNINGTDLK